jgi:hypothetical protein
MAVASGRQRNYALAMGIRSTPSTDRHMLSNLMDRTKASLDAPPNQEQVSLAQQWGIKVKGKNTGKNYRDELYDMIIARSFVYSIVRRMMKAKWKYFEESGLNDEWVTSVASEIIYKNDTYRWKVKEMDNAMSGTKSDAWFRFGEQQLQLDFVLAVADVAQSDLPPDYVAQYRQPSVSSPTAISTKQSSRKTASRTRRGTKRKNTSGCAIVLATVSFFILAAYLAA